MCQGLPCIGAKVLLRRSIRIKGIQVPAESEGIIREEYLPQREVLVYFEAFGVEARLAEADLGESAPL